MLADPQSVTISGTATSLPRLVENGETFVYQNLDNFVDLFVTQKVAKDGRRRATVSLQKSVIVTDPITGLKSRLPYSVTSGFSFPIGVTAADVEALFVALNTLQTAFTNAFAKKVIGGEK